MCTIETWAYTECGCSFTRYAHHATCPLVDDDSDKESRTSEEIEATCGFVMHIERNFLEPICDDCLLEEMGYVPNKEDSNQAKQLSSIPSEAKRPRTQRVDSGKGGSASSTEYHVSNHGDRPTIRIVDDSTLSGYEDSEHEKAWDGFSSVGGESRAEWDDDDEAENRLSGDNGQLRDSIAMESPEATAYLQLALGAGEREEDTPYRSMEEDVEPYEPCLYLRRTYLACQCSELLVLDCRCTKKQHPSFQEQPGSSDTDTAQLLNRVPSRSQSLPTQLNDEFSSKHPIQFPVRPTTASPASNPAPGRHEDIHIGGCSNRDIRVTREEVAGENACPSCQKPDVSSQFLLTGIDEKHFLLSDDQEISTEALPKIPLHQDTMDEESEMEQNQTRSARFRHSLLKRLSIFSSSKRSDPLRRQGNRPATALGVTDGYRPPSSACGIQRPSTPMATLWGGLQNSRAVRSSTKLNRIHRSHLFSTPNLGQVNDIPASVKQDHLHPTENEDLPRTKRLRPVSMHIMQKLRFGAR